MEVPIVVAGPRYVRLASAWLIALEVAGFCVGMLELLIYWSFVAPTVCACLCFSLRFIVALHLFFLKSTHFHRDKTIIQTLALVKFAPYSSSDEMGHDQTGTDWVGDGDNCWVFDDITRLAIKSYLSNNGTSKGVG